MGMIGCFVSVGESDLEAIFDEPRRLANVLNTQLTSEALEEFEDDVEILEEEEDEDWELSADPEFFDVDKAWQGIHFLLTGSDWEGEGPLAFILQGGREIPGEDFGYGPPHAFNAAEVQEIERELSKINPEQLYNEADQTQLTAMDIYPAIWDRESKQQCIGYLIEHLKALQRFIKHAAEFERAVIVYIG